MTINTKLDEKLEGVDNFRAWKYRVMLILEENNLEGFIEANISQPNGDEDKAKYKKILVKEKSLTQEGEVLHCKEALALQSQNPSIAR